MSLLRVFLMPFVPVAEQQSCSLAVGGPGRLRCRRATECGRLEQQREATDSSMSLPGRRQLPLQVENFDFSRVSFAQPVAEGDHFEDAFYPDACPQHLATPCNAWHWGNLRSA